MKNHLFLLFIFISSIFSSVAQDKGMYINIGFGYNVPALKQEMGRNFGTTYQETVVGSFGKGVTFGPALGYMFSNNIGAELNISYLSGAENTFQYGINTFPVLNATTSSSMLRFIPALKITTGTGFRPYMKMGYVIVFNPKIEQTIESSPGFGGNFNEVDTYTGSPSTGFMAAIGADFKTSDVVSIFTELNFIYQNWIPEKVDYAVNIIYGGSPYHEGGSISFVDNAPNNSTTYAVKRYFPFNSVGLHAGLKFKIGSSKTSTN